MASYYQLLAIDYRERAVEALYAKNLDDAVKYMVLRQECLNLAQIATRKLN